MLEGIQQGFIKKDSKAEERYNHSKKRATNKATVLGPEALQQRDDQNKRNDCEKLRKNNNRVGDIAGAISAIQLIYKYYGPYSPKKATRRRTTAAAAAPGTLPTPIESSTTAINPQEAPLPPKRPVKRRPVQKTKNSVPRTVQSLVVEPRKTRTGRVCKPSARFTSK